MFEKNSRVWLMGIGGFLAGAFIGYLYRPAAFLIGQLPFRDVISRGTNLKGLDQIYIPVAQTSFNYLVVGGMAGAILGVVVALLLRKK